jgi:hypothetical protein
VLFDAALYRITERRLFAPAENRFAIYSDFGADLLLSQFIGGNE